MNIFYLDENPVIAAQYHTSKHVVKMMLEYSQMLFHAIWVWNPELASEYNKQFGMYKALRSHANHPCTKWVAQNYEHWDWVLRAAFALEDEWRLRYNHKKEHKTIQILRQVWRDGRLLVCTRSKFGHPAFAVYQKFVPPPQAMPDHLRGPNTVEAYRTYYINKKIAGDNVWSHPNNVPYWAAPFYQRPRTDWKRTWETHALDQNHLGSPYTNSVSPSTTIRVVNPGDRIPDWSYWNSKFVAIAVDDFAKRHQQQLPISPELLPVVIKSLSNRGMGAIIRRSC